jgi:hypothetical protein
LAGSANFVFDGTNVGIGIASPTTRLDIRVTTNPATDNGVGANTLKVFTNVAQAADVGGAIALGGYYNATPDAASFGQIAGRKENSTANNLSGYLQFATLGSAGTMSERMRIDSGGNVMVGITSNGGAKFHSYGASGTLQGLFTGDNVGTSDGVVVTYQGAGVANYRIQLAMAGYDGVIRMRNGSNIQTVNIAAGGLSYIVGGVSFGKNVADLSSNGLYINAGDITATISANNTYHVYSSSSGTYRFYVNENGGVNNFSGNNVNLSDERSKTNIEIAGSYLNKICAIPVKLFNYKDESEGAQRTLGVIAQDVESVAPELVSNDGWEGSLADDGTPLKGIYTQDIVFALMKAIQEQQALIENLTTRLNALESK